MENLGKQAWQRLTYKKLAIVYVGEVSRVRAATINALE